MSDKKKDIPTEKNRSEEDIAINHKANESDGREINHQQKSRREIHQPRDNA